MAWHLLFTISGFVLSVVCIVGNILVILAVITQTFLRTLQNMFIASLAFTDLLMGLFVIPLTTVQGTIEEWVFGPFLCYVYSTAIVTLCGVSLLHLVVIALDRYLALSHGVQYLQSRTWVKTLLWISLTWVISVTAGVIPLIFNWESYRSTNGSKLECRTPLHEFKFNAYISSLLAASMVLMQVFYARLVWKLRRVIENKRHVIAIEISEVGTTEEASEAQIRREAILLSRERRVTRVLGIISCGFLICWMPYLIVSLLALIRGEEPVIPFLVSQMLAFSNSALNPFLYTIFSAEFRKGFAQLLGIPCFHN